MQYAIGPHMRLTWRIEKYFDVAYDGSQSQLYMLLKCKKEGCTCLFVYEDSLVHIVSHIQQHEQEEFAQQAKDVQASRAQAVGGKVQ